MPSFVLRVLSNPLPGREDEYNRWYSEQHLNDVLKVPGFLSAQRFELALDDPLSTWRYMALYEFESEDPMQSLEALKARAGGPDMVISEAMDLSHYTVAAFAAITPKIIRA